MGGRSVDHFDRRIVDHRHRLFGGGVGQAQHHRVNIVQKLAAGRRVFPPGRVDRHHRKIVATGQAIAHLQTGGARFAVDKDLLDHNAYSFAGAINPAL